MRAVTIKDAKAHLNELIDAAVDGEQVVLLRGSKHVAAIVPLGPEQLEIVPELSDAQAQQFWARIRDERLKGKGTTVTSAAAAVAHLSASGRKRQR